MSIVIVGVGNADFSGMQFLDDSAKPGKRDIAQFVQFNKHGSNSAALTSETLREIPDQLVQYFQSRGIAPSPALQRTDSTMSMGDDEEIDLALDVGENEIVVTSGGMDFVNDFNMSR
jgi:Copine